MLPQLLCSTCLMQLHANLDWGSKTATEQAKVAVVPEPAFTMKRHCHSPSKCRTSILQEEAGFCQRLTPLFSLCK